MEKDLDPGIIKSTQASLGKYVKRPPLSEKLLKKPPFRFIHDIITTVLKTTGFFEGLFEENELVSDNVKDRDSKILFLNKAISVIGFASGKPLSVKSSKIVAGQEPDKTNELLQCLAQLLDQKISSDEAVKKYKEGTKSLQATDTKTKETARAAKKSTEPKKTITKSSEKLTIQKKEQKDLLVNNGTKERSKSKDKEGKPKQESSSKISPQKSKTISRKASVENENQQSKSNNNKKQLSKVSSKDETQSPEYHDEKNEGPEINPMADETSLQVPENPPSQAPDELKENLDTSYTIPDNDLNSSISSHDLLEVGKLSDEIQEQHNTLYSNTVIMEEEHRDAAVKTIEHVKEIQEHNKQEEVDVNNSQNNISNVQNYTENTDKSNDNRVASANNTGTLSRVTRPTSVRPSSSRPGAPRFRDKHGGAAPAADNLLVGKVNIIVENAPNEEEEDTSIIIVEQESPQVSAEQPNQLAMNQHGHLVQQILDSQKEFSHVTGKTEIEWQFGAQKAREALNQEIEQVRFNIQALSRAANPLGKLLDHIQEDVEVMRQELQQWTRTYEETSKELTKQKIANDDSLLPLHTKIKQLDLDIKEKQDKVDDLKIVIHKNSARIEKLLASGNVQ